MVPDHALCLSSGEASAYPAPVRQLIARLEVVAAFSKRTFLVSGLVASFLVSGLAASWLEALLGMSAWIANSSFMLTAFTHLSLVPSCYVSLGRPRAPRAFLCRSRSR